MADEDGGAQPAAAPAARHWLQAAPPNFRHRVLSTIVRELSKGAEGIPAPQLHAVAVQYENKVLKESSSQEQYLSVISRKMGVLKLQVQRHHQLKMGGGGQMKQQQQGNGGLQTIPPGAGDSRAAAAATPRPASSQPQIDMHADVKQPMAVAQLQVQAGNFAGLTGARPNAQPNHQNADGMGIQKSQTQQVMRNQQGLSVNKQQRQGYQTPGPGAPATMGGVGEVDWREDMLQKITRLKDSHASELAELDREVVVHPKTKEQLESASKEEAQRYIAKARLKGAIRSVLNFLHFQKGDLHEGYMDNFGKCQKIVLDLVQVHREKRDKSPIAARNAASRSSSTQSHSYGAPPPPVADPAASGGGVVPCTGGTNGQQAQHEQPAVPVVQTVSSPPLAQNVEVGPSPAAPQQSHGDNLQHGQPAVAQTVSCSPPAKSVEAGAPPAALQQSHGYQLVAVKTEDGVAVSGSADARAEIVGLTDGGDSAPSTGGTCSQQEQQEPRPADEGIPPGSTTQHVSSGTPPPAQQQNQSGDEVGKAQSAGDEVRGGAEGPMPVAQEETTASKPRSGTQAMRSFSPAALRSLANDMGVNLKRAFRHEPEWPWDSSVDEWERRQSSSGGWSGAGYYKRRRTTTHYSGSVLDDEIQAASAMLVDTAIVAAGARAEDGSTEIELLYNPISLTPELKLAVNADEISARLLVPRDYPRSSPVVVLGNSNNDDDDDKDDAARKEKGVPTEVDVAFQRALEELPEPRSVERMAMAWDACARTAVVEFAHRFGGGTSSSWYRQWMDV